MNAVVFDAVRFTYPGSDVAALEANVTVPEGVFALVAGPTGSGKSTLLRAINGLVPHFSGGDFVGRVVTGGRDTLGAPPRAVADVVAFVPQDPASSFVLDRVEDELAYGMENLGVAPKTMRRRVEETLDLLAIAHLRDRSVSTLSGGERQRVAIGAALAAGPRIVVLDEPTSQLDPQGAEDVLAALQRLVHDLGMTVAAAEHRLERVAGFADEVLACRVGAPVVRDAPAELLGTIAPGPPVARLGRMLGWSPVPLTVRAARRLASGMVLADPARPPAPAVGDVLVRANGLGASHGSTEVLTGIDVVLRAGEVVVLLGRNGAGKTTLLRALAGLHEPHRGSVVGPVGAPRTGVDVALCPQNSDDLLFADSVIQEVRSTLRRGRGLVAVDEVLDRLGLTGLGACHPRDLSAGQRLLVAIAAIVSTGAPVLLLDEPTRGLDPETKAQLGSFLTAYAAAGNGVLFATHDVELAARVATRALMLAGGEVIADGAPSEVLGDSPVFAPQTARVFGPRWLTPDDVARAPAVRS